MDKIGIALIGCGYWGSKLQRYIQDSSAFDLKYVCNSKSNLEVWKDKDVSAVIVATPNETHYEITRQALLHRKSVMCEKPLALTEAECLELKMLTARNLSNSNRDLELCVEYTHTFSKALQRAKELIDSGMIGKVLGIEMATKHLGRFGGGSVYWLLGSRMLAVLDMFVPLNTLGFWADDLVVYDGKLS